VTPLRSRHSEVSEKKGPENQKGISESRKEIPTSKRARRLEESGSKPKGAAGRPAIVDGRAKVTEELSET
jgi:hypothetical protein